MASEAGAINQGRRRLLQGSAAALLSGLAGIRSAQAGNDLVVGKLAPPLVLRTLDGRSIDTRELSGQVVIATFWATWCAPCREELGVLSRFQTQHAKDGVRVLGFSLDTPEHSDVVKRFAQDLSFPLGLLGSPWVPGYGRIWKVPVSFVIDRAGTLVYDGWQDGDPILTEEKLRRIVLPLLHIGNATSALVGSLL